MTHQTMAQAQALHEIQEIKDEMIALIELMERTKNHDEVVRLKVRFEKDLLPRLTAAYDAYAQSLR